MLELIGLLSLVYFLGAGAWTAFRLDKGDTVTMAMTSGVLWLPKIIIRFVANTFTKVKKLLKEQSDSNS